MIHYERMQKRLEAILNSMGDAVIFAYHDGRIRQVNPTFDMLFGYAPDEIHRARLVYLAEPEYQAGLQATFMRVRERGGTERLTLTAQRKNGTTFISDWVISPIQDDDESGVVCMVRDVTEDKRVKKTLKSTKEYLRLLVNTAPVTLQIIDPQGFIVLSEGQALGHAGYAPEQVAGRSAFDLYAEAPQVLAHIERALAGEVVREVHALGEAFLETICVPSWDEIGNLEHIIVVQVDITAHKRAQQELARKERRYRALFEQSNDAVFLLSLDGRVFDSNQRALDLTGYTREELTSLYCYELVTPDQREGCHATFRELQQGLVLPPYERFFQRKDGSLIPVEVNMEMVRNGGGQALHIQSIVRDISGRRAAQEAAFQLRLEQEKVRLMNQFIQNVAHEFRTPLSIINTNAYLVQSDPNPANHPRYATMIEGQIQAVLRLVETLQRMTRLESLDTLSMETEDLAGLLRVVLQKLTSTYANKRLEIHERLPERMRLSMSANDLYAALYEIIDNAFRFTPDGGTVHVSLRDEQEMAMVIVDDSGVGIQPNNLPHVFEKLYREDEAHSTRGFGLGLSIAKRVIELHGGAITLHSEPHRGTSVMVYLPKD